MGLFFYLMEIRCTAGQEIGQSFKIDTQRRQQDNSVKNGGKNSKIATTTEAYISVHPILLYKSTG